jgi:alkylation response protein AidB-like acyl-CoA dehydrogenase
VTSCHARGGGTGGGVMDFEKNEEQRALCDMVRRFGRSLNESLPERDQAGTFNREGFRRCGELGIQGLPIPAEYGGSGHSLTTTMLAMEALGYACRDNGLVFSLNAQMWAVELPLLHFGTEAQRRRWLPGLCRGELVAAHAITEPDSGSDAMAMQARAVREGDEYVLNGAKTFVTNAPVADLVLVFATVNPKARFAGITGFLVERGTPGLELSDPIPKMGLRTSPMGEVVLTGCRVPVANRLGAEGAGVAIFNSAMEWERACIFASHLGAMDRLLEETIAYARTRKQFGQPISRFAPVADAIVDMKVALEAGRLLLYRVAAKKDAGEDAILDAALAKLFVSEAHVRQALAALQVHGGYGYTTAYGVERELRDAIPGTLYSGTSEMQRKIIARLLGL